MIARGSCTCSNTSLEQYLVIEKKRVAMLNIALDANSSRLEDAFVVNEDIRSRLKKVFLLDNEKHDEIVLFPSGTDAELLPLCVALIRSFNLGEGKTPKVTSFVMAAGEVGSGTDSASGGKHFSKLRSDGSVRSSTGLLEGLSEGVVDVRLFKPRGADGQENLQEDELMNQVGEVMQACEHATAVLHIIMGSKTGLTYPSTDTVHTLRSRWGSRLLVVIDACQLRSHFSHIKDCVSDNMPCLVTGSKFFASAPFCGAVVLPALMRNEIETHMKQSQLAGLPSIVPMGISEYLTIFDIPSSMVNLKAYIQTKPAWTNPGLALRWWGGITNMEAFCSLPSALVEKFSRAWVKDVRKCVLSKSPFLECFDVSPGNYADRMIGEVNTIVSIIINVPDSARNGKLRRLSLDESKSFHRAMGVPTVSSDDISISQAQVCIGQPVKLSSSTIVLRIALGADIVLSALKGSLFQNQNNCDEALSSQISSVFSANLLSVNKMHYIAKNWSVSKQKEPLVSFL
jgi:hypothetical protein